MRGRRRSKIRSKRERGVYQSKAKAAATSAPAIPTLVRPAAPTAMAAEPAVEPVALSLATEAESVVETEVEVAAATRTVE